MHYSEVTANKKVIHSIRKLRNRIPPQILML